MLALVGLTNAAPHEALSDASATARLALRLLARAVEQGHDTLANLLAVAQDGSADRVEFSGPARRTPPEPPVPIPDAHVASHATVLPARPGKRAWSAWQEAVDACTTLRCPMLVDRIAAAEAPSELILARLLPKLETAASEMNTERTATLLGAISPLFAQLPSRRDALALEARLSPLLDPLGRCEHAACPSCAAGRPCALDTWRLALARSALAKETEGAIRAFFGTTGQHAGSGVYAAWRKRGWTPLADATLRLVHQHWIEVGQHARAQQLAQLAWAGGCRDPEIAEAHAIAIARAGREPDLRAALDVCTEALTLRAGNTDDAWRSLAIRQAQIAGRIERGRVCYTGEVDAAGNPIIARRHQPRAARRVRQPRFLRV